MSKKSGDLNLDSTYCFMERYPGLDARIFPNTETDFLSSPLAIPIPEDVTIPNAPANNSDFSYLPGIPFPQTNARAPKKTSLYYYVPLHFNGTVFGYALIGYPDCFTLPDCCSAWIRNICIALESLRIRHTLTEKEDN